MGFDNALVNEIFNLTVYIWENNPWLFHDEQSKTYL